MKKVARAKRGIGVVKKATSAAAGRANRPQIAKVHTRRRLDPLPTTSKELQPRKNERSLFQEAVKLAKGGGSPNRVADLLKCSHKKGDRRATYSLATWCIHGLIPGVRPTQAFKLLRQSARAGIREAFYDLGRSYEIGFGTSISQEKAFEAYIEAARRGDVAAMNEVARCLYWGIGTSRNRRLANLIRDFAKHATDGS